MNDGAKFLTVVFVLFWAWNLIYFEELVFMHSVNSGNYPNGEYTNFVVIADPQLTDFTSYSFATKGTITVTTIQYFSDLYMKRSFHYLLQKFQKKTNSIVFLGDMLDSGRTQSDKEFEVEFARFNRIFNSDLPRHFIPGNHDVGLHVVDPNNKKRYIENFGLLDQVMEIDGFLHVFLNSLQLDSYLLDPKSWEFLENVSASRNKNRILYTHIPLWRPDHSDCKLYRTRPFVDGRSRDYQNMLSMKTSQMIIDLVKPIRVFSGDDHEPCEYKHGDIIENTVSTFSWLQGTTIPGFGILSTNGETGTTIYHEITTPRQLYIYIWYVVFLGITIVIFLPLSIVYANNKIRSGRNKKLDAMVEEIQEFESSALQVIKESLIPFIWLIGIEITLYFILHLRWI
jgi:hypothetical protein